MIPTIRLRHLFLILVTSAFCRANAANGQAPADALLPTVHYTVSLARAADHLVEVQMSLPPGASTCDVQLPVWNALYQVRDFAQYVNWLHARTARGNPLQVRQVDKTTWRIAGAENGARLEYEIFANEPGPYGAQLNTVHAFFNLAEILMYPVDSRHAPATVRFTDVPGNWRIATALSSSSAAEFTAPDYDHLVDGPIELGTFRDASFDLGGTRIQVVVDAEPADYDMNKIVPMVKSIVTAAISWMDDRPMDHYVFLYHFPHEPGGGGMEHAFSTAIDLEARILASNPEFLDDVTAHEFFHLWNVKRIRPQSQEPIDYTRENYSPSLWFSEGVTSTVGPYILLRSGLLTEQRYLKELGDVINDVEHRPAHLTQSPEESSLNAWLEKYAYYRAPERSVSYYEQGEILGVLLDLDLRELSHGTASLRDLFHWMNDHYARQGKFFPDSAGVREAAEAVSHAALNSFFQKYVAGSDEIPYDDFFKTVGLRLDRVNTIVSDPGFRAVRNFGNPPSVSSLEPGSAAARAGLAVGDSILEFNGQPARGRLQEQLGALRPGESLHLKTKNRAGEHDLVWKLAARNEVVFSLKDVDNVSPQQRARRKAWLAGEDQSAGDQ